MRLSNIKEDKELQGFDDDPKEAGHVCKTGPEKDIRTEGYHSQVHRGTTLVLNDESGKNQMGKEFGPVGKDWIMD